MSSNPSIKQHTSYYPSTKSIKFVGTTLHNKYHGSDCKFYNENHRLVYRGSYSHGLPNGLGERFYPNGATSHKGTFKNGVLHGTNCWEFREDTTVKYSGDFQDGLYSGKGKKFFPNSKVQYEGTFSNGLISGLNCIENRSIGTLRYFGDFKDNDWEGNGIYYYENCAKKYEGTFKKNLLDGPNCIIYNQLGKIIYKGEMVIGKEDGQGVKYLEDGKTKKYEGQFSLGKLVFGKSFREDGSIRYEGSFDKYGKFSGQGECFYQNGNTRFNGNFFEGYLDDENCLENYTNGVRKYTGSFKKGVRCGNGASYYENGAKMHMGNFLNGECEDENAYEYKETGELHYKGSFVKGNWEGKGIRYYNNGDIMFKGRFVNGHRYKGREYRKNGVKRYYGYYKDGFYNDLGRYFDHNGNMRLDGAFYHGLMHCENGKQFFANTKLEYEGGFEFGMWNGFGKSYKENTDEVQFEGWWVNGQYCSKDKPTEEKLISLKRELQLVADQDLIRNSETSDNSPKLNHCKISRDRLEGEEFVYKNSDIRIQASRPEVSPEKRLSIVPKKKSLLKRPSTRFQMDGSIEIAGKCDPNNGQVDCESPFVTDSAIKKMKSDIGMTPGLFNSQPFSFEEPMENPIEEDKRDDAEDVNPEAENEILMSLLLENSMGVFEQSDTSAHEKSESDHNSPLNQSSQMLIDGTGLNLLANIPPSTRELNYKKEPRKSFIDFNNYDRGILNDQCCTYVNWEVIITKSDGKNIELDILNMHLDFKGDIYGFGVDNLGLFAKDPKYEIIGKFLPDGEVTFKWVYNTPKKDHIDFIGTISPDSDWIITGTCKYTDRFSGGSQRGKFCCRLKEEYVDNWNGHIVQNQKKDEVKGMKMHIDETGIFGIGYDKNQQDGFYICRGIYDITEYNCKFIKKYSTGRQLYFSGLIEKIGKKYSIYGKWQDLLEDSGLDKNYPKKKQEDFYLDKFGGAYILGLDDWKNDDDYGGQIQKPQPKLKFYEKIDQNIDSQKIVDDKIEQERKLQDLLGSTRNIFPYSKHNESGKYNPDNLKLGSVQTNLSVGENEFFYSGITEPSKPYQKLSLLAKKSTKLLKNCTDWRQWGESKVGDLALWVGHRSSSEQPSKKTPERLSKMIIDFDGNVSGSGSDSSGNFDIFGQVEGQDLINFRRQYNNGSKVSYFGQIGKMGSIFGTWIESNSNKKGDFYLSLVCDKWTGNYQTESGKNDIVLNMKVDKIGVYGIGSNKTGCYVIKGEVIKDQQDLMVKFSKRYFDGGYVVYIGSYDKGLKSLIGSWMVPYQVGVAEEVSAGLFEVKN